MRGARGVWAKHIAVRCWKGLHGGVEAVRVYCLCKHEFDSFSSIFPPFLCMLPLHLNRKVMKILTSQAVELVPLVSTVNLQF